MADIAELRDKVNTKTLNLVLLTFPTAGIYPILWLNKNYPIMDSVTKKTTADSTFIIWLAICAGLSGMLGPNGGSVVMDHVVEILAGSLSIAYWALCIIWAFRARAALQAYCLNEHKLDLEMNRFYTFLFTIYYVNYCINDLPEASRKQAILSGASTERVP